MQEKSPDVRTPNEPDLRTIGLNPNFWYPLAVAKNIKKGNVVASSFAGEPIALVRTESNQIYALEDRCAHRQMPLSCGVVQGEKLKCCYHGWLYDEHGQCAVPYLPEGVPLPHGVRTYPTRIAYGLVFVFPGDPMLADTVPLPDLPEFHSPSYLTISVSRLVRCHYSFWHENLMDMNHQFLHRRWMGKFEPPLLAVRKDDSSVEVDYRFDFPEGSLSLRSLIRNILGFQSTKASAAVGSLSDGSEQQTKYDSDFMTISTHYPYQSLMLRRPSISEPLLKLWVAYVPVDLEQRVTHTCGVVIIRRPRIPWLGDLLLRPLHRFFSDVIFEEDQFALEAEQRAYDQQGADWNQEILPFIMDLRHLLIAAGVPAESGSPRQTRRLHAEPRFDA
jgi:phenylpropionate dioxygenase-like ring-hydroxylating dioxygenase large terminal subunit